MQVLLEQGAKLNIIDEKWKQPLYYAAQDRGFLMKFLDQCHPKTHHRLISVPFIERVDDFQFVLYELVRRGYGIENGGLSPLLTKRLEEFKQENHLNLKLIQNIEETIQGAQAEFLRSHSG